MIILVGRPETKTWWRNFHEERDVDVLIARRWLPMTARAIVGADEPETIAPLLDLYLTRFPQATRPDGDDTNAPGAGQAVLVWCRPR